jgi:hypothetical protein
MLMFNTIIKVQILIQSRSSFSSSFSTFGRIANGIGLALMNFGVDSGCIDSVVFFCVKHPMPIFTSTYRRHFCDTSRWSKIYEAGH